MEWKLHSNNTSIQYTVLLNKLGRKLANVKIGKKKHLPGGKSTAGKCCLCGIVRFFRETYKENEVAFLRKQGYFYIKTTLPLLPPQEKKIGNLNAKDFNACKERYRNHVKQPFFCHVSKAVHRVEVIFCLGKSELGTFALLEIRISQ